MKSRKIRNSILILSLSAIVMWCTTCEPLVYTFDNVESASIYTSSSKTAVAGQDSLKVATWNIRFGAGRLPWFGDACGERVILTRSEVQENMQRIALKIDSLGLDVLFLQEVDVESKRSAYIDQVQWLLNHSHMNYAAYAPVWHAQYIPSDGLGRMNMGTAILSRWPLKEARRIALPLRGDQDALTKYFYLRRNILKARLDLPQAGNPWLVNVHTAAFSVDDTKQKHINRFLEILSGIDSDSALFIAGGDLNTLPPGSDSTDFCMEDACPGERFHRPGHKPFHKEGSSYTDEQDWLSDLYARFQPAVPLGRYQSAQSSYFTHTTNHPSGMWNRKLDYMFCNGNRFVTDRTKTIQEARACSDHAPLVTLWRVGQ